MGTGHAGANHDGAGIADAAACGIDGKQFGLIRSAATHQQGAGQGDGEKMQILFQWIRYLNDGFSFLTEVGLV